MPKPFKGNNKEAYASFFIERNGMGLFSSKKKVSVNTTVLRAVEDSMVPNSGKNAVTRALYTEQSITEAYREAMTGSVALKVSRMHKWAKLNYHYGLPKSSLVSNITGKDVVKQVIESKVGVPVTFHYYEFAPANSLHMGWESLVKHHGYNPDTNQLGKLTKEKGTPVYLKDMQAVYTTETFEDAEPGTLEQWGPPATKGYTPERLAQYNNPIGDYRSQSAYIVDDKTLVDYVEVHYVYSDAANSIKTGKFTMPMTGYNMEDEYYHIKYSFTKGGKKETVYWSYEDGSGEYPAIDAIYLTNYDEIGSFMPNVYFQLKGLDLTRAEEKWYPPHITSTKLCKFLGFDYVEMGKNIREQSKGNSYEQAYMTLSVPYTTKNQIELLYLFRFFSLLYDNAKPSSGVSPYAAFTPRSGEAITISDKGFSTTLSHQGIARRRVAGKIGKVGHCESGTRTIEHVESFSTRNGPDTRRISTPCRYFRYQSNSVFYEEVAVYGASFRYHIYGKHHIVASGEDSKLLIPIDHALTRLIPANRREELLSRSFHYVFNTVTITKTKWYQSSIFKAIVMVVAVAIAYFSAGGLSGISAAMTSLTTMGVAALAVAALQYVSMALLVRFGTQLLVKELGAEFGMLGAILVAAAAIYFSGPTDPGAMNWSENLLTVSNGLMDASQQAITQMNAGLNEMMTDFLSEMDLANEAMTEAQKLLGSNVSLNPFDFIGKEPIFVEGESPDDYFNRSVHAGNVGVLGIEDQTNYVANAVRLPTFSETMQGALSDEAV